MSHDMSHVSIDCGQQCDAQRRDALTLSSCTDAVCHMQVTEDQRHASDTGQLEGNGDGTLALVEQPDAAGQL